MAGIEDVQPKQLSSLGQPLIQPLDSAVSAPNLAALEDEMRKGQITAQDLFERVQASGARIAQNTAAETQAREYVSPNQVEARQAAVGLATAQAKQQTGALNTADLEKKHYQYFGTTIFGSDGKPDHDAMAHSGLVASQAEARLAYAQAGLTRTPMQYIENGVQKTRFVNQLGDDVTNNPDGTPSKLTLRYQQMRNDAFESLHMPPKAPPNTPKSFASPPENTPVVEPTFDQWKSQLQPPIVSLPVSPDEARGWLVGSGVISPSEISKMSPFQAAETYQSFQDHLKSPSQGEPVVVQTPTHQIEVTAKQPRAISLPVVDPAASNDGALTTGYATGFSPPEIVKTARESQDIKGWSTVRDVIGEFNSLAGSYSGKEPGKITTQKDVALANTLIRLQNPGGTGRGFGELHIEKLEDASPWLERLAGAKGLVLKEHAFTKETRDRLITEGRRLVNSIEQPARDQVSLTVQQLHRVQANPADYLNAGELSLLTSVPFTAPAASTASGAPVVIGGRTLQPLGNGQYRVIQ